MKRGLTGLMVAMLAALSITPIAAQKNTQAEAMLAAAKQKETLEGDLNGAIKQYKEIVAKYSKTDRATAAMALVRMADAYRRMGDGESLRIYEEVVKDYPEQKDAVTLARAAMGGDASAGQIARTIWTSTSILDQRWSRLSPDGRFLSFTTYRNDDVFLREISTRVDRNLTNQSKDSKDHVFESVFSPDGKRIAYSHWRAEDKRYTVRLLNLTGDPNPRPLYDNPDPDAYDLFLHDWSRDGKLAVTILRNDKTVQIGYVSVSDGKLRVLKTLDWGGVGNMRFSADGRYLAYDRTPSTAGKTKDVFLLALDGSSEIQAVEHPSANDVFGGWSPDGKWLLFTSDRSGATDLWALAFADGKTQGMPQRLRANIGGNFQPLGWTPAGALYYQTNSSPLLATPYNVQLASLDISTGKFVSTTMASRSYQEKTSSPVWSPDGKRLAYLSELRGEPAKRLAIRDTDTEVIQELSPKRLSNPDKVLGWAPDGRAILVNASDLQGERGIYRVDVVTSEATAVFLNQPDMSYDVSSGAFAWMPGGRSFLIYASGAKGGVYGVDAQAGSSTLVFQFKQELPPGAFSVTPDGKTLYYTQAFLRRDLNPRKTEYAFIERDLDNGNERELTRRDTALKPNFSPDGQYCAITGWDAASNSIAVLLFSIAGEKSPREVWRVPSEGKGNVAVVGWVENGRSLLVRQDPIERTRETELWLVSLSGDSPKRVVGDGSILPTAGITLSPNGRQFAYTISDPAPPLTFEVVVLGELRSEAREEVMPGASLAGQLTGGHKSR